MQRCDCYQGVEQQQRCREEKKETEEWGPSRAEREHFSRRPQRRRRCVRNGWMYGGSAEWRPGRGPVVSRRHSSAIGEGATAQASECASRSRIAGRTRCAQCVGRSADDDDDCCCDPTAPLRASALPQFIQIPARGFARTPSLNAGSCARAQMDQ